MFVFLELAKNPAEQGRADMQAPLSLYEQAGVELAAQIPELFADASQPIYAEFGGKPILPDPESICDFNSYSLTTPEAGLKKASITVLEIKNPLYEKASQGEESTFGSLSPGRQEAILRNLKAGRDPINNLRRQEDQKQIDAWRAAKRALENTPKNIYIIKGPEKTIVTSKEPRQFSPGGLPLYEKSYPGGGTGLFTYGGKEVPEAFAAKISGERICGYGPSGFKEKRNITTTAPTEPKNYIAVKTKSKTFYVKKSAQLEDKAQPEGIMK